MPSLSGKKLITNRQLNFTLSPVDLHNAKQMPLELSNYEIDGTWNQHQSILLDIILDKIFRDFYHRNFNKIPRSWRSKETIDAVGKNLGGIVNQDALSALSTSPYEAYSKKLGYDIKGELKKRYESSEYSRPGAEKYLTFEQYVDSHLKQDSEFQQFLKRTEETVSRFYDDLLIPIIKLQLFEDYPLEKYRYKLNDYLKNIEQTKFRMTHKVKYIAQAPSFNDKGKRTDKGQLIDLYFEMRDFQQIFQVQADEKDNLVLNFKTPLGKMILHNMLILDTDYCPFEIMNLSKNAYFIYKRFILNRVAGAKKATSIELNFNELKNFLNIRWGNDSGVYRIVQTALRDMIKNDLIGGFTIEKHHIDKRRYKVHFENEVQKQEEPTDQDLGILKF